MNKYELLAVEEIEMTCECCKKQHIGKAYTFRNCDTLDIIRVGSTCASKLIGKKTVETLKAAKRNQITEKYQAIISKAHKDAYNGTISYDSKDAIIKKALAQENAEKHFYK
jgi:hypothetical protein